jgi:hypothetical protein
MNEKYQPLYSEMLKDIERCLQLELPEKENAESCFWIANKYWEKLKEVIKNKVFKDESEEIDFFRNVKPQFTCNIEYFILLSEALLFIPEERPLAVSYWEEEMRRFKRFCDKYDEFIKYYESDKHYNDSMYFLRKSGEDLKFVPTAPVYDVDVAYCTSHDQSVRSYLAHKKYYEFARQRREILLKEN